MNINFKFLDNDSLENVITCMHYKLDKVVFFGYDQVISDLKDNIEQFLINQCGVSKVEFIVISQFNINKIKLAVEKEINNYKTDKIFFDLSGNESLLLVVFGMLAEKYDISMHTYDINSNKLKVLTNPTASIENVKKQNIEFTLDSYIKLQGGIITKSGQAIDMSKEDISNYISLLKEYNKEWTYYSTYLRNHSKTMDVNINKKDYLPNNGNEKIIAFLMNLVSIRLIEDLTIIENNISFKYVNKDSKSIIISGGKLLECIVYSICKDKYKECLMGVCLDWDGQIPTEKPDENVSNEIDVLYIIGNKPTFISCKSGKLDNDKCLDALYELETVSKKFGGKYLNKILFIINEVSPSNYVRAKKLGIKIILLDHKMDNF